MVKLVRGHFVMPLMERSPGHISQPCLTSDIIFRSPLTKLLICSRSSSSTSEQGLSVNELQNYLGSAVIVFNLRTKQLDFSSILEVSRVSSLLGFIESNCTCEYVSAVP